MSEDNEALARRALATLADGDAEALIGLCDPEVECRPLIAGVEGGPYRGHEGIKRWFAELSSSFDERRPEILSIEPLGDDTLVCELDLHLRGRGSGVEIDQRVWGAARFRAGLVLWWGFFETREEALTHLEAA
ncbi:MAG TPA: nuclear transport factor 2 family protein [Solirubrobacterales bacterium]